MSTAQIILAIFGIAALMVVHETGHFLAARKFGMRVTTFSIGFGPALWRHKPPGSPTTYQIALIPFLAYVKIDGMNPFEEVDPTDKGSYANASLIGRIVTIFAGPFANYAFATLLIFGGLMIGGLRKYDQDSMRVDPRVEGPAMKAGVQKGDRVLSINGEKVDNWSTLSKQVSSKPGQTLDLEIERNGQVMHVNPRVDDTGKFKGRIRIQPYSYSSPVGLKEALWISIKEPPLIVAGTAIGIARILTLREKPQVQGMKGIVEDVADAIEMGPGDALEFLGRLSAYLGGFNLLPFPALDGGRLLFLGYEAVARRRANEKTEAKIHAVGLLMFLALMLFVTVREFLPQR